ncbi:arsenite methyltransferase [Flammeovirgaceae bacterium SG7u.111]|nr:arsenite methyltransferase [Flammeovirgaceae bacterium SG7u.132]WPO37042.1 arsenite methyltransferase [Flammeovirgaceae bacterium SG7u.111]
METPNEIKKVVREKYAKLAVKEQPKSCCGSPTGEYANFNEDYSNLEGYNADADLGLGCGLPTEFAQIKEGDTVVDLGSGAGNDCFVARQVVGEKGKVIGVDMTPEMIDKARINAAKLNFNNVEFRLGEIENLPIAEGEADVVVSNCVLNLVPDKVKAVAETFRILKPGGHFSISDIVTKAELPAGLRKEASMYAGCVSGALPIEEYMGIINSTGFEAVQIQKERKINLPKETLEKYLSEKEVEEFMKEDAGIFSITVYAQKPGGNTEQSTEQKNESTEEACCGPTCCS